MMRFKTILGTLVVMVLLMPLVGHGQVHYRTPPQRYQAVPYGQPYFYYFAPRPEVVRRWDRHIRWLDYDRQFRSPYNPESSVEYMLRTF